MVGRLSLRRAYREWHRRREWHRHLGSLEPWLIAAARKAVFHGVVEAQGSPSGRAFVGVRDVLAQVRRDPHQQAALGALLSARSPGATLDDALDEARADERRADNLEIPAWTAAAALRRYLEMRQLPIDTDAYDPVHERPDA